MAYSTFTLPGVLQTFGLTAHTGTDLFAGVAPLPLSPTARAVLAQNQPLASLINTEKAWSELVIAPVLAEVWQRSGHRISLYSGVPFDVDPAADLTGVCDFILGRGPHLPYVTAPVVVVVEAKKEDIPGGYGQCAAAMVAARRFNLRERSDGSDVFGCVSNGASWKFLRLRGADLAVDLPQYSLDAADRLVGIFLHLLGAPATP
ncbi:MAG: hypothetical protein K2X87_24975 [Gemmataceae bacterium]|nr:hypothetical protein [Gemmataceae bacterium]